MVYTAVAIPFYAHDLQNRRKLFEYDIISCESSRTRQLGFNGNSDCDVIFLLMCFFALAQSLLNHQWVS